MFSCEDCGCIFDEPDEITIPLSTEVGWWGERWTCCPECRSTNLLDAEQCDDCGDWFSPWELANEWHICEDCKADRKRWKEIKIG